MHPLVMQDYAQERMRARHGAAEQRRAAGKARARSARTPGLRRAAGLWLTRLGARIAGDPALRPPSAVPVPSARCVR